MSTKRPPAIAGVSTGKAAAQIVTIYPSIAGTIPGRLLGQLLDCLPVKIGGIKLSHLLFGLPAALLAAPGYFSEKVFGSVYTLTNKSVQTRRSLGNRLIREVALTDVDQVVVRQLAGQQFYPAAELDLVNKSGDTLMTLSGIPRADIFRQSIVEARDARNQIAASLKTIDARHAG
ncbi:MAG: hypothetical protein EXS05_23505 [Planctomycetaceae bacterium]|nr:hypothetical protein [Planctomycetaceae bacterium]